MSPTRTDVVNKAHALFGETQAAAALALVDDYGTQSREGEVNRVKLAILEVSDGKLSRLAYFVMCAKIDYRDVLVGGKLPAMTDEEEAKWQASANRFMALWSKK
ncbi:hypothetical protein [Caenimonas koreensis]|uniref:Uncharacterized protein n=1 Tax=Caenimonas koreensis DSM 17982 TaxID=1121255 RepID=A0A844B7Q2_9BURK|nr:hypothetical protein [Caenimonas koreensis]MRD47537.1 hypothetical protein [Caenimonas koreensis DSM 17982]